MTRISDLPDADFFQLAERWIHEKGWDSAKHKRGHQGNAGQFAAGSGGGTATKAAKASDSEPDARRKAKPPETFSLDRLHKMKAAGDKDICNISPPICGGNLGISRKDMPQLPDDRMNSFLRALKKYGVHVKQGDVPVGRLKATQKEINGEKVLAMADAVAAGKFPKIADPIVVSRDGYILDGHHRWATLHALDPKNKIRVRVANMDIRALLKVADRFSAEHKGFGERVEFILEVLRAA